MSSLLSHLECSRTGERHDAGSRQHLSRVGAPLLARYDLDKARASFTTEALASRPFDLWRYREVLPVSPERAVRLGEGGTPLLPAPRVGAELGLRQLYVKDESRNPTGSFKARGMAVAVSMALELGARELIVPTAGNAGAALAAYASRAGIAAHVVVAAEAAPRVCAEASFFGTDVREIEGLIGEAGRIVAEECERNRWYDLSTLKEPYRVEGKKTMAYELYEQLGGELPDVVLYPTGGGTGLIGMWKAFDEMETLGWIGSERPRLVAVQAAGCAPVVEAMASGRDACVLWENARTVAPGLRVPKALADFLILRALRETRGGAVAVPDEELLEDARVLATKEGISACPEGGACLSALRTLLDDGSCDRDETVVLFNTATSAKYLS